jgi:hypothetical protein
MSERFVEEAAALEGGYYEEGSGEGFDPADVDPSAFDPDPFEPNFGEELGAQINQAVRVPAYPPQPGPAPAGGAQPDTPFVP